MIKHKRTGNSFMRPLKRCVLAFTIILAMLLEGISFPQTAKAKSISIDEKYLEEGMMNILNIKENKTNLIPGLMYKKDNETKLYITYNTAAALAELSLTGGGSEYSFSDDNILCTKISADGEVYSSGKNIGSIDTFKYKDKLYADMEQILSVLGVQFTEENDRMVYLPRQKTIIDYFDAYMYDLKSVGVNQAELNINHDTYGTAFCAGLSLVFNNFDVRIFVPVIGPELYEKDVYENALLQLAVSDDAFYTEDMMSKIDSNTRSGDIGNLVDIMSYATSANDILQLPTAYKDWADIRKDLEALQKEYASTKFSKSFEADAKLIGDLDNFSYAFELVTDAYAMFNIYAEATKIQERSNNWTDDYVEQLQFLSTLGSDSYGDEGKQIKEVSGKLAKEHNFPTGAALKSYANGLGGFAINQLANLSPIGPIITVTNCGTAMLKSDPNIKSAMENYEKMYTVRNLIQVQNIARIEMEKKYNELKVQAVTGTINQKDIDIFRVEVNLLLKCALRNCSLTIELYEGLAKNDWSAERRALENKIAKSAELLNRLENTEIWDYEECVLPKAENYYSTDYGFVRQPITENVWVAGASVNNGTNYVYSEGYTYFWKNTAAGYDSEYVWGNYMPKNSSDSQLVRVDEAGNCETIYTGNGYGNLGVCGKDIYFNSTDGIYSINTETLGIKSFGSGEIQRGDDSSGFLICGDYTNIFSINMSTGEKFFLNSGYARALEYDNGVVYFYECSDSYNVTIYMGSIDGSKIDTIAGYSMDDIFGAGASTSFDYSMCGMTVSAMQVMGDYLYYCVGARGGTGSIWQGGNIYRTAINTLTTELLVGGHAANDSFRVAYGNDNDPVKEKLYYVAGSYFDTSYVMDLATMEASTTGALIKNANTIFGSGLELSIYRGTMDNATLLVGSGDYDNHGAAKLGSYGNVLVQIKDAQVCGPFIYFNVWYSTEYDAISLGWRTGYKRESTTIYRKNIETGVVEVVHAY